MAILAVAALNQHWWPYNLYMLFMTLQAAIASSMLSTSSLQRTDSFTASSIQPCSSSLPFALKTISRLQCLARQNIPLLRSNFSLPRIKSPSLRRVIVSSFSSIQNLFVVKNSVGAPDTYPPTPILLAFFTFWARV